MFEHEIANVGEWLRKKDLSKDVRVWEKEVGDGQLSEAGIEPVQIKSLRKWNEDGIADDYEEKPDIL